ncbi:MAG TPA: hypothetical protein VFT19_13525 [Solirubrobacterales bacterium]|nr:hypothetical protein [Solirubrobacterales bacterium]
MARGVVTIADTQTEAEDQILDGYPEIRVLGSRAINLEGLPGRPWPKHWVVVVEHRDPEREAELPQHENPAEEAERTTRQQYLAMSLDPEMLIGGSIEQFACPACGKEIRIELPAPREKRDPGHADCPECGIHLCRAEKSASGWDVFQPPESAAPQCIFCDARANSREHVIPAWISKRFGIKDFLSPDDVVVVGGTPRKQPISFASYRARIFCSNCNTHFKHLEDAVIPLLVPMAKGFTLSLDQASQALLALWANKTAMALIAADPSQEEGVAPLDHRRAVRQGRIADNTWVSFFAWGDGPMLKTGSGTVTGTEEPSNPPRHYGAMLAFAGIGFYVTGFTNPLESDRIDGEPPPVAQFWPPKHHFIHWPPPIRADGRILPALLNSVPLRPT